MKHHYNISDEHTKEYLINTLSSYLEVQNKLIIDLLRSITTPQIETLQTPPTARDDTFESIDEYYERIFLASIGDLEYEQKEAKKQFNSG
jgi:hypothetical protein